MSGGIWHPAVNQFSFLQSPQFQAVLVHGSTYSKVPIIRTDPIAYTLARFFEIC